MPKLVPCMVLAGAGVAAALDIDKLPVPDDASGALVGFNAGAHTIAKGTITAQYGR